MLSLALTHTAEEVQFYCLDLAGGGLVSTAGLPHVGSIATRLERDRVLRTIEELAQLLERREQIFTELGIDSMVAYRAGPHQRQDPGPQRRRVPDHRRLGHAPVRTSRTWSRASPSWPPAAWPSACTW